jgi:hypothetical protein
MSRVNGWAECLDGNKGINNMTTLQSPIATFTTPLSATFGEVSHAISQYFGARAQKARLAAELKALREMDPHMLNDIGMKGFNRLSPAEQEVLLLDAIKHAARS